MHPHQGLLYKVNPLPLQNQRNLSDGIRPRADVTFTVHINGKFTSRSKWLSNLMILCISNYKPMNAERQLISLVSQLLVCRNCT